MKLSEERKIKLINEAQFSATRSSGPGGQNVNKVSSRVELRFSIVESTVLQLSEKERITAKLNNRINSNGDLVLNSQAERSQIANKEAVIQVFIALLEKALTIPKRRIKTGPTKASKIKRLEAKKITGKKKQLRKPPDF